VSGGAVVAAVVEYCSYCSRHNHFDAGYYSFGSRYLSVADGGRWFGDADRLTAVVAYGHFDLQC